MRCRDCGYALWNLTEPRCPECGLAFDLRSYRFVPDTVAFACPACGNLHAGSGDSYLPATSDVATCRACGQPMRVAEMRVVPQVDDPPDAIAYTLPWDNRHELGWWRAWWGTTKLAMLKPSQVVRQSRPDSSWRSSYLFAVTTFLIGLSVNTVLFGAVLGVLWLADSGGDVLTMLGIGALVIVGVLVYAAAAPLFFFLLAAAPAHLFLWLFAPDRKGRFATTARFVNYAQAPMAVMVIPFFGFQIGSNVGTIWMLVCSILMLRDAHRISGVKATFAVLWLPILLLLLYVAALALFFTYMVMQP